MAEKIAIACAHCFKPCQSEKYRCPECGLKVVCHACAKEVGLMGPAAMLAVAKERATKEEKQAWHARKAVAERKRINRR